MTSLTHSHHVVPPVQVAHIEALSFWGGGNDQQWDISVSILQDANCPCTQEPADSKHYNSQHPQHTRGGDVWHSLGRTRQENPQNPGNMAHHIDWIILGFSLITYKTIQLLKKSRKNTFICTLLCSLIKAV